MPGGNSTDDTVSHYAPAFPKRGTCHGGLRRKCNWPRGDAEPPILAFPPMLAYIAADFTRYFLAGKVPGPIDDLLRQGAPANGPQEMRAQGWAVAYCIAVADGVITDGHSTRTVSEAFAIDLRTIQRWLKQQRALGVSWQDLVPDEIPKSEVGQYLTMKMREAGAYYMSKGRLATPRGRGDI